MRHAPGQGHAAAWNERENACRDSKVKDAGVRPGFLREPGAVRRFPRLSRS